MSMFRTHENHIPEIEAAIEKHGEIYIHGDGNIYHKDSPISSDNAVKYAQSPPGRPQRPGPASYRVRLDRYNIPADKEALDEALLKGMADDMVTTAKQKPGPTEAFGLGKVQYKTAFPGQTVAVAPVDSPEVAALKAEIAALKAANEEKKSE